MYALRKRKRIDAHIHHGGEKDAIGKCPGFKEIIWTGEFSEEEMKRMTYTTSTGVMARLRQVLNLEPWPAIGALKLEHLIESMDRANVVHGVLCGMDVEFTTGWGEKRKVFKWAAPLEYTKECIDRYPDRFFGQLGVWPARGVEHCISEIERARKVLGEKFVGIKIFSVAMTFPPDDEERCYPIYKFCEDNDITLTIHHWPEPIRGSRLKYASAFSFDNVFSDFPDLKTLILHGGLAMGEERLPYSIFLHAPNTYLCTTPLRPPVYARHPWEWGRDLWLLKKMLELYPDRILWGTDYPVSFPDECAIFVELALEVASEVLDKFFFQNAKRFFNIKE